MLGGIEQWAVRVIPLALLAGASACGSPTDDPGVRQLQGGAGGVVSAGAAAGIGATSGSPASGGPTGGATAGDGGAASAGGQSNVGGADVGGGGKAMAGNAGAGGLAGVAGAGGSMNEMNCREATLDGSMYLICGGAGIDRAGAHAFCLARGAELLKLESAAEEQRVYEAVTEAGSIWLGANDIAQEGDWRWPDDSAVSTGYAGWSQGQPNDSGAGEDCAVLHSGMGAWNDVACDSTAFDSVPITVVCEP